MDQTLANMLKAGGMDAQVAEFLLRTRQDGVPLEELVRFLPQPGNMNAHFTTVQCHLLMLERDLGEVKTWMALSGKPILAGTANVAYWYAWMLSMFKAATKQDEMGYGKSTDKPFTLLQDQVLWEAADVLVHGRIEQPGYDPARQISNDEWAILVSLVSKFAFPVIPGLTDEAFYEARRKKTLGFLFYIAQNGEEMRALGQSVLKRLTRKAVGLFGATNILAGSLHDYVLRSPLPTTRNKDDD